MASNSAPKTISLRGCPANREGIANAAITPGHLIEQMTSGKYRVHGTAGAVRPARLFAREQLYTGKGIDTAYSANDSLPILNCQPGDQVYALVAASAAAIVIGDLLESAGDGTLRKCASYLTDNSGGSANTTVADVANSFNEAGLADNFADLAAAINRLHPGAVARAVEAVDNSGGGAAVRIRVEII